MALENWETRNLGNSKTINNTDNNKTKYHERFYLFDEKHES